MTENVPAKKIFGQNAFYYYGPGGGGVNYPDQYFYNLDNKLLMFVFDGPYENDKTPSVAAKQMEDQILSTFKFAEPTLPTKSNQSELGPVIYSITPLRGSIGTKITIKGKNLNGFEGDLNARIATEFNFADYSSGIMYGERNGSSDTIVTTIQSSFCKQDNSYSGLPCTSYFYITPGVYEISVKPYDKESNSVSFTVTE